MNLVFDWNGTLFGYVDDTVQNKTIAYGILDAAKTAMVRGRLWRISDIVSLLRARSLLHRRLAEHRLGKRALAEVYEPFNRLVIAGRPVSLIHALVESYAHASHTLIDTPMVAAAAEAKRHGTRLGILSVSYDWSIRRILELAGFGDLVDPADCIANRLECSDGVATRLTLDIYGEKAAVFQREFLERRGFDAKETFYSGDRIDDDGPVAPLLPKRHFIVPLSADADTKQALCEQYDAFVPDDEADLRRFLRQGRG